MTPFPQTEAGGGDKKQLRPCLPRDSKVMLMFLMVQAENWWIFGRCTQKGCRSKVVASKPTLRYLTFGFLVSVSIPDSWCLESLAPHVLDAWCNARWRVHSSSKMKGNRAVRIWEVFWIKNSIPMYDLKCAKLGYFLDQSLAGNPSLYYSSLLNWNHGPDRSHGRAYL